MADPAPTSSKLEQASTWLVQRINGSALAKHAQTAWLRNVSMTWVKAVLARRTLADGLDQLTTVPDDRGVLLVSNHRSFFDQYSALLSVWTHRELSFAQHLNFPVRSEFFFDQPAGLLVNLFVAAGAMYPPIYRDTERRALNDQSLDKIVELLATPGNLIGIHPEGTRGKGDDPYKFLPAQPGVGKLALLGKPTVIPLFNLGLGNNFVNDVKSSFDKDIRRTQPIIQVFGAPLDYSDLLAEKPRPTLYKKAADRFMKAVGELAIRERELRAQCLSGAIGDDDPRWLSNVR